MEIRPVDASSVGQLADLFRTDKGASGCWCMWFIVPVNAYHAAGAVGNRASFCRLMASSKHPTGLIAQSDGKVVGWCALGPRSRYARAIKAPTYKGRDPSEDDDIWLVPCLFLRKEARKTGVSERLIGEAIRLARARGARAIEAFPHAGAERRSKDTQVGFESVFSKCGFVAVRRPSPTRVIMRLDFGEDTSESRS
jgi:GNAT superfamily N-acetyltransferase